MSKLRKFKQSLGKRRKSKLRKQRANDKRNIQNKIKSLTNSHTKIKGQITPKIIINPNLNELEDEDIDKSFTFFEYLENKEDEENHLFNSYENPPLNLPEISNVQVNDLYIESFTSL